MKHRNLNALLKYPLRAIDYPLTRAEKVAFYEQLLKDLIKVEDYEHCAKVRDELNLLNE